MQKRNDFLLAVQNAVSRFLSTPITTMSMTGRFRSVCLRSAEFLCCVVRPVFLHRDAIGFMRVLPQANLWEFAVRDLF
jgi:hypothetical protein